MEMLVNLAHAQTNFPAAMVATEQVGNLLSLASKLRALAKILF
jgi:hypothetical protein